MTGLAGLIGYQASLLIGHSGALVAETYDGPLMAINYARAASADFALMQLAALRLAQAPDDASRALPEGQLAELKRSLAEDLDIALERSREPRTHQAASRAREAVEAWDQARRALPTTPSALDTLCPLVRAADREMELLINYTAGDGFAYRQRARDAVVRDRGLNMGAVLIGVLFSGGVSWLLARHIIGQVAAASAVAKEIARGELDGPMPPAGGDELGALLRALAAMRDNLRAMMQREVALRQTAQGRLLDAMESSHEGIVVVASDCRVILANERAIAMLGWRDRDADRPVVGIGWSRLATNLPRRVARCEMTREEARCPARCEVAGEDGRWLSISRSPTREGGFVVVISDVTTIKEQSARLRAINLRLDTALANMSQGLCLFDAAAKLVVVNERYCELFRLPRARVRPGLTLLDLIALRVEYGNHAGTTAERLVLEKMAAVEQRRPASFNLTLSDGRVLYVLLRPASGGGWAATYEDVTERRRAEERVVFMARHDALTALPNRTLLAERLQREFARLGRRAGLAVLCLDLDRFKVVNDTLGHAAGDLLLQTVARRLQACVREEDVVARMGGDEFIVVQTAPCSAEGAIALARRIIEAASGPYDLDDNRATVGVSVGIAMAPADGASPDVLLRNADMALYRAKAEGRGIWRFYRPEMDAAVQARRAMGSALRGALDNGEFDLCYQPIYDLKSERVRGFEALLRWNSPGLGPVSPAEFVPVAEELGLMRQIGGWVIQRACVEASSWPEDISVSVNVSPVQFAGGQLVATVNDALDASSLASGRLNLEVTETVLFAKTASSQTTIGTLRALGVRTTLDDFGTGYSSLSYLANFPIDEIKVDQSFLRDLASPGTAAIVRAIIGLARTLSLRVVAEGVETAGQLRWLREEGCDDVQGFLLAPAVAASEVQAVLDRSLAAVGHVVAGIPRVAPGATVLHGSG